MASYRAEAASGPADVSRYQAEIDELKRVLHAVYLLLQSAGGQDNPGVRSGKSPRNSTNHVRGHADHFGNALRGKRKDGFPQLL
ncbi:hypothetical protein D3C76_1530240 [compost metagenome]